jgi:NAD(P)-dependent dehydrogenase (short-subunit alcohol dehydrogenase family)
MSTSGRGTVLVTGATDGLGRALARDLAGRGMQVLLHGRDDERGAATLEEIRRETGSDALSWFRADLADLAQVRDLADRVAADHPRLDVLVNNAGIGAEVPGGGERQESADGHELRFAVNFLAGHLLTRRLLGPLRAAGSAGDAPARVVMVSSAGQAPLDFDDLMLRRDYSGWRAYCQSKLAQILDAFDLADQLDAGVVTATALHPATYMPTKIVPSPISTIAEGVAATARLAVDPELAGVTGRYYNGVREARPDPQALDPLARRRLREIADELTGA